MTDPDLQRRALVAQSTLRAVSAGVVVVVLLAFIDPRNSVPLTLGVYTPTMLALAGLGYAVQRGHVSAVGWALALFVWALVSFMTALLGGLEGHNSMALVVAVAIAGTVVGARAALAMALLSACTVTAILLLQLRHLLPKPIAPPDGVNSLTAILATLLMTGWLLHLALKSQREALALAERNAQERDAASARLNQSQRLETVGRLAAGVAHDLNNVLSVVRLSSALLKAELPNRPDLGPVVEDLALAVDQATLLTRRLVSMGRTDPTPAEPLEAGLVIEQFAPLLRRLLPSHTSLVVKRVRPLAIQASRSALELVVLNLVVNARDAMPRGGVIEVTIDDRQLTVRDEGDGIPPEVLPRLFTPFFTTKPHGTGLGLTNVSQLSRTMAAEVSVSSTPGQGAVFSLRFASA